VPDYHNLPKGYALTRKYIVQEHLGKPGAFGVVYKVFDTLADADRALKLILYDRHSTTERLRKEYRTLRHLPAHEHVVKVIDADFLVMAHRSSCSSFLMGSTSV
jgi:serine/threonine protein kinase